jgi:predicted nucleic acid-binding Zn ribbon protein
VAPKTPLAAVQLAWSKAAGAAINRVASPVSERDGVITVACGSAGWAEQLDLLQDELLAKLRAALGGAEEVRGLRFRVADRPHSPPAA